MRNGSSPVNAELRSHRPDFDSGKNEIMAFRGTRARAAGFFMNFALTPTRRANETRKYKLFSSASAPSRGSK